MNQAGYQGPDYLEEKKVKPPEECEWEISVLSVADNDEEPEVVFAAISVDKHILGSVRLPNPEYLRFLRERIQDG